MKTHLPILAIIAFGALHSSAEELPELKKSAHQTGASQDQLRGETRRVNDAIAALREEFHEYRSMQGELSTLESAIRDLAGLEQHDMPDTSGILKDASRLDDPKELRKKLIAASWQQKKMQVILREIADRLYLQQDLVLMRKRYYSLAQRQATNLREIRRAGKPDAEDSIVTAGPDQLAIAREIFAARVALEALASHGSPLRTRTFAAALARADEGKLVQTSENAALTPDGKAPRAVPEKAAALATLATLKSVIATLDTGRSAEDRANELVRKLDELLKYQDTLSRFVPKVTARSQDGVIRGQGYLSDEMDLAQDGIAKLHEEASRYNSTAREKSENLVGRFEDPTIVFEPAALNTAVGDQNAVAADLTAARDLLQKKAEELAKENSSPEIEEFLKSLEEATVSEAAEMTEMPPEMRELIRMLLEAKAKIKKAKEMLKEQKDPGAPREQVAQSGKDLKEAGETADLLEGIIPPEIAEHIGKACKCNGDAAGKLGKEGEPKDGPEGKQPGADPGGDLDQAEAEIDKALEALKKMMCMCMSPGGGLPSPAPGKGPGQAGEGQGQGQGDNPQGKGMAKRAENTPSDIKPVETTERDPKREALLLLEKEKAPSEYEEMVDQYIRNLGKGELPSR
ncbi:hypothetical protein [Luteolibacter sp. Populi]|uniref:hypothetical protein n=1 Tax=Luteolibacter sp. Populi TaxID=3230487 RepID=UPI003466AC8E